MSSSLRDIPGAGGSGRRRGGVDRKAASRVRTPHVPVRGPAGGRPTKADSRRRRSFASKQPVDRVNLIIGLCFATLAVVGLVWLWNLNQASVSVAGITDGATITPQEAVGLTVELSVSPTTRLDTAVLTFDGEDVTDDANVEQTDDGFVWTSPPGQGLEDGEHTFTLEMKKVISGTYRWSLTFDVEPAG